MNGVGGAMGKKCSGRKEGRGGNYLVSQGYWKYHLSFSFRYIANPLFYLLG